MAVTRLLRIKETKGSNRASHLKKNIFYICRDDKTANGLWIGGNAGRTPDVIYRTMVENKKFWCKEDGSQAFHYMLSFPPDCGIDEATAFQVAEEFCNELLGENYYYVFAVHNDRAHMHVHITFDSVSKTDGLKFHSPKGDWEKRIQPITDRICEKYHLPALDYGEERRGRNYGEWKKSKRMEKGEYYSWTDIIRDDIDEAIEHSEDYEIFLTYLREDGYTVTRDGKFLSLLPAGAGRAFRTGRLGNGYAKEEIIQRIADKAQKPKIEYRYKTYGDRQEMREVIYAKIVRSPGWKMTPFQRKFWRRWNNTYFIRKPDRVTKEQRQRNKQDILEIRKLSDAIHYTIDYDICDEADLEKRKVELKKERDALSRELSVSQTKYYKKQPFYSVARCEKLKEKNPKERSPDEEQKIKELMEMVESVCPYEEAVSMWRETKGEMDKCRCAIRDIKKEEKIVDDIFRLHYQMEPPIEEIEVKKKPAEPEKSVRTIGSQNHKKPGREGKREQSRASRFFSETEDMAKDVGHTVITINKKLFVNMDEGEGYLTRIPYHQTFVRIPKSDGYLSENEEMLTAWLRDDQVYPITDAKGIPSGTVEGKDLKVHYEDKTKRKRKESRNGRKYSGKEWTAGGSIRNG